MRWLLGGLAVLQVVGVWMLLSAPPEIAPRASVWVQAVFAAIWAILFLWGAVRPRLRRAIWLIAGFILYSVCRLLLFAQSDYDRQRLPFYGGVVVTVLCIMVGARWIRASRGTEGE